MIVRQRVRDGSLMGMGHFYSSFAFVETLGIVDTVVAVDDDVDGPHDVGRWGKSYLQRNDPIVDVRPLIICYRVGPREIHPMRDFCR